MLGVPLVAHQARPAEHAVDLPGVLRVVGQREDNRRVRLAAGVEVRVPVARPELRELLATSVAACAGEMDDLGVVDLAVARPRRWAGHSVHLHRRIRGAEHRDVERVDLVLARLHGRGHRFAPRTRDGEEPTSVVHLDLAVFVSLAATFAGLVRKDEDLHTGARRADLGVAVQAVDDPLGPRLGLAAGRVDALIEVDPAVRIVRREDIAHAGEYIVGLGGGDRLVEG